MKCSALFPVLLAAGVLAGPVWALSSQALKAEQQRIAAETQAARASCQKLDGNAKTICLARAQGDERVGKAELRARHQPTAKHLYQAHLARAEADYAVARQRCAALADAPRKVCRQDAQAAYVTARENAKVARAVAAPGQTRLEKAAHVAEVRQAAAARKNDANHQAAVRRCEVLAGDAKTACVSEAQRQFGKQ